jgi:dihydroorotate dehydrogenase (NAD+) catalytic subunit
VSIRPGDVDLTTTLADLHLDNPVMTASGCGGYGRELRQFFPLDALGALVTPSVTRDARAGGPAPRGVETPSGMLNATGLEGPGIDTFLARELPWLLQHGARPIVSIAGTTLGEYAELARRVGNTLGVAAVEVNLAGANAHSDGFAYGRDPTLARRVAAVVRRDTVRGVPVFVKLSPDVTSIVDLAGAVVAGGADGVVLVGALPGLHIDPFSLAPTLAGVTGGLSGPAIRPVALRAVWEVAKALPEVPIIGVGGIRTGVHALEFLAAGASAVQVGTGIFTDPTTPVTVVAQLRAELAARGLRSPAAAVGVAHHAARAMVAADRPWSR